MARPGCICKLKKGELIDTQEHFVDTFNWMLDCIDRLKGERGIKVTGVASGSPVISTDAKSGSAFITSVSTEWQEGDLYLKCKMSDGSETSTKLISTTEEEVVLDVKDDDGTLYQTVKTLKVVDAADESSREIVNVGDVVEEKIADMTSSVDVVVHSDYTNRVFKNSVKSVKVIGSPTAKDDSLVFTADPIEIETSA